MLEKVRLSQDKLGQVMSSWVVLGCGVCWCVVLCWVRLAPVGFGHVRL